MDKNKEALEALERLWMKEGTDGDIVTRRIRDDYAIIKSALTAKSAPVDAEAKAEEYIQAAIDNAPEPLKRLGQWLSEVLDADDWNTVEPMLLAAAIKPVDAEKSGMKWMDEKFPNPADRDYSADDMIDAFMAGMDAVSATKPAVPQEVADALRWSKKRITYLQSMLGGRHIHECDKIDEALAIIEGKGA